MCKMTFALPQADFEWKYISFHISTNLQSRFAPAAGDQPRKPKSWVVSCGECQVGDPMAEEVIKMWFEKRERMWLRAAVSWPLGGGQIQNWTPTINVSSTIELLAEELVSRNHKKEVSSMALRGSTNSVPLLTHPGPWNQSATLEESSQIWDCEEGWEGMGGGWLPVAGLFGPRRPNHGGAHALPLKYNTETQSNTTAWDGCSSANDRGASGQCQHDFNHCSYCSTLHCQCNLCA